MWGGCGLRSQGCRDTNAGRHGNGPAGGKVFHLQSSRQLDLQLQVVNVMISEVSPNTLISTLAGVPRMTGKQWKVQATLPR